MASVAPLSRPLLAWFRKNARPLPWRDNRDPYPIWISEVMLQQTQVATVIPYFNRFLKRFPDLRSLARADEQSVLHLWQGLGYYRRARDLLRAARSLHELRHATIPDHPELLRSLPGFGRYTTNAVLSQAYGRRVPILEANSQRVLCRLFAIEQNPKAPATQRKLWSLAEELLPERDVGDFNQALMELGALVCTPKEPDCAKCPLKCQCLAHLRGRARELPMPSRKPKVIAVTEVAVVVRRDDRCLLVQRPNGGRWEGMWEFPHREWTGAIGRADVVHDLLQSVGVTGTLAGEIATIRHGVTHHRITLTCVEVRYLRGRAKREDYAAVAWVHTGDLHRYPLSTPQRRLARLVEEKCATPHTPPENSLPAESRKKLTQRREGAK
jgi:A/G-specific adenine glycosylase